MHWPATKEVRAADAAHLLVSGHWITYPDLMGSPRASLSRQAEGYCSPRTQRTGIVPTAHVSAIARVGGCFATLSACAQAKSTGMGTAEDGQP